MLSLFTLLLLAGTKFYFESAFTGVNSREVNEANLKLTEF